MNNQEKIKLVNKKIIELKKIAEDALHAKCYDRAMDAVAVCAYLMYSINQVYKDDDLEKMVSNISQSNIFKVNELYNADKRMVLFYDGFGLDLRGLAVTATRGIVAAGWNLIYVTRKEAVGSIPHIVKELQPYNATIIYIDMKDRCRWAQDLNNVIQQYRPVVAFFYTTPDDVSGAAVFSAYKGKIKRIQIDLTDHAFWLGTGSVDYITEMRELGISNAVYHRGFRKEQIEFMDALCYINRDICTTPLPFDIFRSKYIFSGGSLYKTLGDEELLFYKIVDYILKKYLNIYFLYAGIGDDSQIKILQNKYAGRVFLIDERPDFFRLIENCEFFLNTYPMFGGMMMRYAALAGKLPVTLRHDNDANGMLYNQSSLGIEYETFDELIEEIDKLLTDEEYRKNKEENIKKAVMTEEVFVKQIDKLISDVISGNESGYVSVVPDCIDTEKFRYEYIERFDYNRWLNDNLYTKKNRSLVKYFFMGFLRKFVRKVLKSL